MKTVIGIIGEKGSGKGTFVHILQALSNKSVGYVKSSELLAETLNLWGIPLTRNNLQQLAIIMDNQYGVGSLSRAVQKRIDNLDTSLVVYESIRWQSDAEMIRSFPNSILIYITAPVEVRYRRTLERHEKIGEGNATFEQFVAEEKVQTETAISDLASNADFKIENIGTKEGFEDKIKDFMEKYLKLT